MRVVNGSGKKSKACGITLACANVIQQNQVICENVEKNVIEIGFEPVSVAFDASALTWGRKHLCI